MLNTIAMIIADITDTNTASFHLTSSTRLREDLGLDSLQLAQLTVEIEDRFDIDIFENGMVSTVGQILEKIQDN